MSTEITSPETGELLRKWLRGDATAREERALLAKARKDPFLADALSGYLDIPGALHDKRTQEITHRLALKEPTSATANLPLENKKIAKNTSPKDKKIVALPWLRRVAAAVVVLGLAIGIYAIVNNGLFDSMESMAVNNTEAHKPAGPDQPQGADFKTIEPTSSESQAGEYLPNTAVESSIPTEQDDMEDEKPAIVQAERKVPDPVASESALVQEEELYALADEQNEMASAKKKSVELEDAEQMNRAMSAPQPNASATDRPKEGFVTPGEKLYGGKVVDKAGNIIVGATVAVPGTSQGVVTDGDGKFKIKVGPAVSDLAISSEGYTNVRLSLPPSGTDYLVVAMEANHEPSSKEALSNIHPKGGYDRLARYIRRNRRYPNSARSNNVTGTVEVTFTVQPDGRLKDVTVSRGLGYGCDEEAVRLIKSGPRWRNNSDKDVKATYLVPCNE